MSTPRERTLPSGRLAPRARPPLLVPDRPKPAARPARARGRCPPVAPPGVGRRGGRLGLTAPFAAALMDRFGVRRVTACALVLVAVGSGATVAMTASWQLV